MNKCTVGIQTFGSATPRAFKKWLHSDDEGLFRKEVKLFSSLSHPNVLGFRGVCLEPCGILTDFYQFYFTPFGGEGAASFLADFLKFINRQDIVSTFAETFPFVVKDVGFGLDFLHSSGVGHRDLKPENILVSNQHYSKVKECLQIAWTKKPITAVISDFGELRSEVIQTATLAKSTKHVRGTPVYMAPENFAPSAVQNIFDLQKSDIWAFGMTIWSLLNPDVPHPYGLEINEVRANHARVGLKFVQNLVCSGQMPMPRKYNLQDRFPSLFITMDSCLRVDPNERCSAAVATALSAASMTHCIVSQCSTLDFERTGINACVFLDILIADSINEVSNGALRDLTQNVIVNFPVSLNKDRDIAKLHSVDEAINILDKNRLIRKNYSLGYHMPARIEHCTSKRAMAELSNSLCSLRSL